MTNEQKRQKILQVLITVIEDGLDEFVFEKDVKQLGLTKEDFKSITRTDVIKMKEDEMMADILIRFCKFIGDELP